MRPQPAELQPGTIKLTFVILLAPHILLSCYSVCDPGFVCPCNLGVVLLMHTCLLFSIILICRFMHTWFDPEVVFPYQSSSLYAYMPTILAVHYSIDCLFSVHWLLKEMFAGCQFTGLCPKRLDEYWHWQNRMWVVWQTPDTYFIIILDTNWRWFYCLK